MKIPGAEAVGTSAEPAAALLCLEIPRAEAVRSSMIRAVFGHTSEELAAAAFFFCIWYMNMLHAKLSRGGML